MKGNIPVRIEPFQLERWMTKYEVNVKWDIAESGIYPMSVREILNLLPPEERATELDRLLDLRLGYSEACGSAELRGLIAAAYENTSPDEILITTGAIEANFLLFNELLSGGTGSWSSVRPTSNSTVSPKRLVAKSPSGNYATTKGLASI